MNHHSAARCLAFLMTMLVCAACAPTEPTDETAGEHVSVPVQRAETDTAVPSENPAAETDVQTLQTETELPPCIVEGPPGAPEDFVPDVVFAGLPESFGEGELEYYSDTEYALTYGSGTGGVIACQRYADEESLRTYAEKQLDSWENLSANTLISHLTREVAETSGGMSEWFTYDTSRYAGLRSYRLSWEGTEEWFILCERRLPDGTLQNGQLCRWDGDHAWAVYWFGEERTMEELLEICPVQAAS